MSKISHFLSLSVMAFALSLSACGSMKNTNTMTFSGNLSGAQEVPANTSAGAGRVDASLDKSTHVLTWTVTYDGLSGPVKAGHFHGPAYAGSNANVALGLTGQVESPIKGSATLTAAQLAQLMAGQWYVNLHTAAHPAGEVRGQVLPTQ